MQKARDLELFI